MAVIGVAGEHSLPLPVLSSTTFTQSASLSKTVPPLLSKPLDPSPQHAPLPTTNTPSILPPHGQGEANMTRVLVDQWERTPTPEPIVRQSPPLVPSTPIADGSDNNSVSNLAYPTSSVSAHSSHTQNTIVFLDPSGDI